MFHKRAYKKMNPLTANTKLSINKYPPAKPGVFQMRAKPYDTGSASRRITV